MTETAALLEVAARTTIVLVALFAGLRLLGRRHAGEARVDDILLILLLANGVQNAMTTGSGRLVVALVSSGTLVIAGWIVGVVFRHYTVLERRVGGSPTVLVHEGTVARDNLRREHLTEDALMMMVRKQGLARIADVKLAILEPNGSISIVKRQPSDEG